MMRLISKTIIHVTVLVASNYFKNFCWTWVSYVASWGFIIRIGQELEVRLLLNNSTLFQRLHISLPNLGGW